MVDLQHDGDDDDEILVAQTTEQNSDHLRLRSPFPSSESGSAYKTSPTEGRTGPGWAEKTFPLNGNVPTKYERHESERPALEANIHLRGRLGRSICYVENDFGCACRTTVPNGCTVRQQPQNSGSMTGPITEKVQVGLQIPVSKIVKSEVVASVIGSTAGHRPRATRRRGKRRGE